MAKTRGGHSASPSSPTPRPHRAAMGAAASPPVQAPAIPPSEGEAPSQRRYPTRRPPTDPVPPVDQATSLFLGHQRREPSSRASHDSGPPIEGNLDCRDRSFHSETYFDIEALRQQPELRDSFRLLQRQTSGSGPHSLRATWSAFCPGDFYSLGIDRRELPSGMLLIDVLLRANLFPFSIKFRGEELYLRHY
ncbi:hypothetical protein CK203_035416 [Vitis vinifera]|uniref:Uncharacterized protein n=1 Tax=Vitis vinifera TaxID=29760 RepID=A0A438I3Q2_VITVI|nr:hypothetical protein CK203_035416 [Vitis vinifera]